MDAVLRWQLLGDDYWQVRLASDMVCDPYFMNLILVTLGGAILFITFGVIYAYEGLFLEE
jgi:hypothetical protein